MQLYIAILGGLTDLTMPARLARIPKKLPLYIFGGSPDPVGSNIAQLLEAYRAAGLTAVTTSSTPMVGMKVSTSSIATT